MIQALINGGKWPCPPSLWVLEVIASWCNDITAVHFQPLRRALSLTVNHSWRFSTKQTETQVTLVWSKMQFVVVVFCFFLADLCEVEPKAAFLPGAIDGVKWVSAAGCQPSDSSVYESLWSVKRPGFVMFNYIPLFLLMWTHRLLWLTSYSPNWKWRRMSKMVHAVDTVEE